MPSNNNPKTAVQKNDLIMIAGNWNKDIPQSSESSVMDIGFECQRKTTSQLR